MIIACNVCVLSKVTCLLISLIISPGKLWKTGYENGQLKTPLFDDMIPTLETWKAAGKTLAIFSSGSVQAQLQFFSFVQDGSSTRDLKPLFTTHFDPTIVGSKLEKGSYTKICELLRQDNAQVTFLTDNAKGTSGVSLFLGSGTRSSTQPAAQARCGLHETPSSTTATLQSFSNPTSFQTIRSRQCTSPVKNTPSSLRTRPNLCK